MTEVTTSPWTPSAQRRNRFINRCELQLHQQEVVISNLCLWLLQWAQAAQWTGVWEPVCEEAHAPLHEAPVLLTKRLNIPISATTRRESKTTQTADELRTPCFSCQMTQWQVVTLSRFLHHKTRLQQSYEQWWALRHVKAIEEEPKGLPLRQDLPLLKCFSLNEFLKLVSLDHRFSLQEVIKRIHTEWKVEITRTTIIDALEALTRKRHLQHEGGHWTWVP